MNDTVLLAVDVGNTVVSLGVFYYASGSGKLGPHWRISTHREQTSDEIVVMLRAFFHEAALSPDRVTHAVLSSTVPPLLPIWERVCSKLFERSPIVVGPGIKTGMPVRYEPPREVGPDRIVNAVAAAELCGTPVIVVDFGTATIFDCVSASGEYLGGALFPGIVIAMDALFERASMLPRVEIARPPSVIGQTTTAALQSGLLYGYAGLVESMVRRIQDEIGAQAPAVATGGLAQHIAGECPAITRVEPFLTLEGLRLLFEKNRPPRGARPAKGEIES